MPENPRSLAALNWPAVVEEALRRRKAERLTQREHAALASVSIPTMAAFERGETTLTLAKAFDILRVLGLLDEASEQGPQDAFVREAFGRWRSLTELRHKGLTLQQKVFFQSLLSGCRQSGELHNFFDVVTV